MNWYPQGFVPYEPQFIDEATKDNLREVIGQNHPREADFISAVEKAITNYKSHIAMREQALPSGVRRELQSFHKKAQALLDEYGQLSPSASFILDSSEIDFDHELTSLAVAAGRASDAASEMGTPGKLPNTHSVELAVAIAKAISDILNLEPTLTKTPDQTDRNGLKKPVRPLKGPVFARLMRIVFDVLPVGADIYHLMKVAKERIK